MLIAGHFIQMYIRLLGYWLGFFVSDSSTMYEIQSGQGYVIGFKKTGINIWQWVSCRADEILPILKSLLRCSLIRFITIFLFFPTRKFHWREIFLYVRLFISFFINSLILIIFQLSLLLCSRLIFPLLPIRHILFK